MKNTNATKLMKFGLPICLAATMVTVTGCETMDSTGPYAGQEFRTGLPALGAAIAPYAGQDAPINADRYRSMQSLQGFGTLIDLLGR